MAHRIQGAWLIIRALAPLIILAAIASAAMTTAQTISRATGKYRDRVQAEVDQASATFDRANEGFRALRNYVMTVKGAVDGVAAEVKRLASAISIPLPGMPPIQIQIPGVPQFKEVVAGVAAAGRVVGGEVDKVTALATVPAQLSEIASATREFAGEIRSAVVRWVLFLAGVVILVVGLWLVSSTARIVGEVRRGLVLLRGGTPQV